MLFVTVVISMPVWWYLSNLAFSSGSEVATRVLEWIMGIIFVVGLTLIIIGLKKKNDKMYDIGVPMYTVSIFGYMIYVIAYFSNLLV